MGATAPRRRRSNNDAVTTPLHLFRYDHWFTQKLSPLLVLAYALAWSGTLPPRQLYSVLPFVLLAVCSVAAYGHIVNDWCDIETDAKAGKANSMSAMPLPGRLGLAAALVVCGFGFLLVAGGDLVAAGLLGLNYLLPTLYSAPPVRFKVRGVAGLLSDATAAHLLPALLTGLILGSPGPEHRERWLLLTALTMTWSFCVGLRGIVIHQAEDRKKDICAGVRTYVNVRPPEAARSLVVRGVLPVEASAVVAFICFLPEWTPVLTIALGVFAVGEASRLARGLRMPMVYADEPGRERYAPLVSNELYEVWLPSALVIQLALGEQAYWPLAGLHLIIFHRTILRTAGMLARFIRRLAGRCG